MKNKFKEKYRDREYLNVIQFRRKSLKEIKVDKSTKYDLIDDLLWSKNIDEDIKCVVENYAFWSNMAENALELYQNFETKLDVWKATKSEYYRNKLLTKKGGKQPTAPEVDNAVKLDSEYLDMHRKLFALYKRYNVLKNCAAKSLIFKKEMIQTKSANDRYEKYKNQELKHEKEE